MLSVDVDADAWEDSHYCAFPNDADAGHIMERVCSLCVLAVAPWAKTLDVDENKIGDSGKEKLRVAASALPHHLRIEFERDWRDWEDYDCL